MDWVSVSTENYDKGVGRLFSTYLVVEVCNKILKVAVDIPFVSENSTYLLGIVFILFMAKEWEYISDSFRKLLFTELFFGALIVSGLLLRAEFSDLILKRCLWTVIFCVPFFCLGLKVSDRWLFLEQTKIATFFVDICMIYIVFVQYLSGATTKYDMGLGYMLLYPMLYHICKVKENKFYCFLIAIEFVIIFMYGSRGPIFCCGIFVVLFLLIKDFKNKSKQKILFRMIVLSGFTFVIVFGYMFMDNVIAILSDVGVSSRTLHALLEGEFLKHGSRRELWIETWIHILEKPFWGWGIAGYVSCMEQYPHLVFLELMLDYGLFLGVGVCLFILYQVVTGLFCTRFNDMAILILVACGLCPLMLSSTYLQEPMFWLLVSFCISINKKRIRFRWNKKFNG